MSSSHSPCAACKYLRRKCTPECVFAPYFPAEQPQKFENVHKVYGASNVAKILSDLPASQRAETVSSLSYEAESRLRDPIYGCVGLISMLQQRLKQVNEDVYKAKHELTSYVGPNGFQMYQEMGQRQQQMVEAQQFAAVLAAREQHDQWQMMLGNLHKKDPSAEQHMLNQQQHQLNQQHELMQQHEFGGAGFNVGGSASGMGVGFEDHTPYPFIPQQEQDDHVQIETQHLFQTRDDNEIQLQHQPLLNHHHQQQHDQERSDLTTAIEMGVGFEDNQFEFIQHRQDQEQHGDDVRNEQQQQVIQTQHLFQTADDYNEIQLQNQPHLNHNHQQQQQQQQEGPGSDDPVS